MAVHLAQMNLCRWDYPQIPRPSPYQLQPVRDIGTENAVICAYCVPEAAEHRCLICIPEDFFSDLVVIVEEDADASDTSGFAGPTLSLTGSPFLDLECEYNVASGFCGFNIHFFS